MRTGLLLVVFGFAFRVVDLGDTDSVVVDRVAVVLERASLRLPARILVWHTLPFDPDARKDSGYSVGGAFGGRSSS